MDRLAVLPFENLSGDPGLDWAGPALSGMLAEQLSASLNAYPYQAADLRSARLSGATRVAQGYYSRDRGRLSIHAVLADLHSRRNVRAISAEAGASGALNAAVDQIAGAFDKRTRPFGTQNAAAIHAWGESLTTADPAKRAATLEAAITADPNFGAAYYELVRLYIAQNDRDRTASVFKRANDRLSQFTDFDRAHVEFLESGFRSNPRQRREALMALSRLVTTDVGTLRALASTELAARRYPTAVDLLKSAVAIEPDNPVLLNELGYAESYRGNLDGAVTALERYRAAKPNEANPLDSLGEVNFFAGEFPAAEKNFLEGQRVQPGFEGGLELAKAALARYMAGDRNGAGQLFAQYDKLHRDGRDPLSDVRKAEWMYMTGRNAEAMAAAGIAAGNSNPDVSAYALCHLSLWAMDSGDRPASARFASRAVEAAKNPNLRGLAALSRYVASPDPKAAQGLPEGPLRELAQAYAALYVQDAAQAVSRLKPMYEGSSPASDGIVRTLYAWALTMAGKQNEARALLNRYYMPWSVSDDALFTTTLFPRFLDLARAQGSLPHLPSK